MTPVPLAANPLEDYLRLLTTTGGFDLQYCISLAPETTPELSVEFKGPDAPMLTARNGELLHAIEHIAAKVLHLEPEEHDRISFDASGFKAARDEELQSAARAAISRVRATGSAFSFPPMTSRERRMLHLALKESGLPTASSGINPRRFVVLYPEGELVVAEPVGAVGAVVTPERTDQIRSSFRRR